MKRFLAVVLAALMLVSALALTSCQTTTDGWEKDGEGDIVIKIGGIGPLTGDYASYGVSVKNGATLAIDEINAAKIIPGVKFQLLFQDSEADSAKAVSAFGKLVDDGMDVSLGGVLSGETSDIVKASAETGMLVLTPTASALNCISEPNAFRVCFNDPQQGEVAAQKIKEFGLATKVALFYDNGSDYSIGNINTFKAKASELGLEIVTEQTYSEKSNTDFSTQITAIKNSGAELVFMPIYYSDAAKFLRQAKSSELNTVFFGVDGLDGVIAECGTANKADCEDVILMTPFYADSAEANIKGFVDAYKDRFDATPDQFAADGYDAVKIIVEAITSAGYTSADAIEAATTADFNAALISAMVRINVTGVTGTMQWSSTGETTKSPLILQIKDGKYVEYKVATAE